jgi:PTS system fructose-specific IIC component
MAVSFRELFRPDQVVLDLQTRTLNGAVNEIVQQLRVADAPAFAEAVLEREARSSTNTGAGVAFPHARTDLVPELILGIGRSERGVVFGGPEKVVNLIFLIGVPQRLVTDYLVCVGTIARIVKPPERFAQLMGAKTADELAEVLRAGALLLE